MNLLIFVEQYNVVGILPSQLEHLAAVANAAGISRKAFVDGTLDGVPADHAFERYATLQDWLDQVNEPIHILTPVRTGSTDVRTRQPTEGWLVIGPAFGFPTGAFDGVTQPISRWTIPGPVLSGRDAVVIALWEATGWRAQ